MIDDLKSGEKIIEAIFAGPIPDLGALGSDPRVLRIDRSESTLRVVTRDDSDGVAAIVFALRPKSIRTIDLNLEDIFMNAVSGEQH